jgi:type I restriction enzyme M protein
MSLTNVIKSVQDIMRQDTGVDGDAQRISQLVWMLFLKIFDDKEQELELLDGKYSSPIPNGFHWSDWASNDEGITGDELLGFINNSLFPTLKDLELGSVDEARGLIVRSVFEDAYNFMKSGTLLRQVVNKINEIDFNNSKERHLFNDIYEKILKDLQSAGNAGEYYTPRAVTQFMVEMTDPKLGDKVFDPACGTGGFLVCTLDHIRKKKEVKNAKDENKLQQQINGVEKKPLPHLLCITNMILHGVEAPRSIKRDNTLSRPLRDYTAKDFVDVIVTNPPFGGIEEDGVQNNFPATFRTKETADLFLILIMTILKPQGRCAIVLPDGTLFGEGVKTRIKEKLLDSCNLHTIVRLPNGVFSPYTGIKTNLLFFTKDGPTKDVWYYEHPYPSGYKSYSKTKPMRIEEFEPEKKWWNKREENEYAWKVTAEEIKANNYNLDIKNPNTPDEDHGDPKEILEKYKELVADIDTTRNELKDILVDALGDGK